MTITIGTAPDSWGVWFADDDKQIFWEQYLDEVQHAGYQYIELGPWGYLPTDPVILKSELDKRNIHLVATTLMTDLVFIDDLSSVFAKLDEILALQKQFPSAHYLVLIDDMYTDLFSGRQIAKKDLSSTEWANMIRNISQINTYVKSKSEIQVVFHPHAETHIETEDQIDRFLSDTDMNLCLDTGHHAYAGGDTIIFIKKNAHRIDYLHLKNCNISVKELIKEKGLSFAEGVRLGVMCDPQSGEIDFMQLNETLKQIKYHGIAVVEQDIYPAPKGVPFQIAKQTLNYLISIGLTK